MESKKKVQIVNKEPPKPSQTQSRDSTISIHNYLHQIQHQNTASYPLDHNQCMSLENNNNRILSCNAIVRDMMTQQYLINNVTIIHTFLLKGPVV